MRSASCGLGRCEPAFPIELLFESPSKGQPSDHVGVIVFATDDVAGMQKYLKEKIKIGRIREPNNNPMSAIIENRPGRPGVLLFLRDPEGHRIAFVQKSGESYSSKLHTNDLRMIHAGIIVSAKPCCSEFTATQPGPE